MHHQNANDTNFDEARLFIQPCFGWFSLPQNGYLQVIAKIKDTNFQFLGFELVTNRKNPPNPVANRNIQHFVLQLVAHRYVIIPTMRILDDSQNSVVAQAATQAVVEPHYRMRKLGTKADDHYTQTKESTVHRDQ